MKTWFAIPLWQRVIAALVLGVIVGFVWGPGAESIKIIGDIFIAFIKILVVPLIHLPPLFPHHLPPGKTTTHRF